MVIFPDAGHFPHRHDPRRFAGLLLDFVHGIDRTAVRPATTAPALITAPPAYVTGADVRVGTG
jgi:hypothetical protein